MVSYRSKGGLGRGRTKDVGRTRRDRAAGCQSDPRVFDATTPLLCRLEILKIDAKPGAVQHAACKAQPVPNTFIRPAQCPRDPAVLQTFPISLLTPAEKRAPAAAAARKGWFQNRKRHSGVPAGE